MEQHNELNRSRTGQAASTLLAGIYACVRARARATDRRGQSGKLQGASATRQSSELFGLHRNGQEHDGRRQRQLNLLMEPVASPVTYWLLRAHSAWQEKEDAMRYRILPMLWVACAAVWPLAGHAAVTEDTFQLRSTGDLLELCSATPGDQMGAAALNFCHGFGIGVFRVLQEVQSARGLKMFCMPDPMPTRNEALAAFVAWGKGNPDKLGMPPQDGVTAFLSTQYACTSKK